MTELLAPHIETPFAKRRQCWFCGEPFQFYFTFPHDKHIVIDCVHPSLSVPCCKECHSFAQKAQVNNIWQVKRVVKQALLTKYKKDLAIGLNWTKQELAESGFEGGNFESFQRSAWFMYEVAKGRVNFSSWPISLNGIEILEQDIGNLFSFDGVDYPCIEDAISQYAENFMLSKTFLRKLVATLGMNNFARAVRLCRLNIDATPQEQVQILKSLAQQN